MKKSVKKVVKKKNQKKFSDKVKNLKFSDIALIKLAVFTFTLWLIGMTSYLPPEDMLKVLIFIINYKWAFFAIFVLAAIKPMMNFFKKKK